MGISSKILDITKNINSQSIDTEFVNLDSDTCFIYSNNLMKKIKILELFSYPFLLREGYKVGVAGVNSNNTLFGTGVLGGLAVAGTVTSLIDDVGKCIIYSSAATIDANAGFRSTNQITRATNNPIFGAKIQSLQITNNRFFVGFAAGTSELTGDTPFAATSGFCFVKKAATNNLYIVSSNSVTNTETDTGFVVTTEPINLEIRTLDNGITWQYCINETQWISITATLPSVTTDLSFHCQIETSEAVSKGIRIYGVATLTK